MLGRKKYPSPRQSALGERFFIHFRAPFIHFFTNLSKQNSKIFLQIRKGVPLCFFLSEKKNVSKSFFWQFFLEKGTKIYRGLKYWGLLLRENVFFILVLVCMPLFPSISSTLIKLWVYFVSIRLFLHKTNRSVEIKPYS